MTKAPDSEAVNFTEIGIANTPETDNPAFGAVLVRFNRSNGSQAIRMTRADAEALMWGLAAFLQRNRP